MHKISHKSTSFTHKNMYVYILLQSNSKYDHIAQDFTHKQQSYTQKHEFIYIVIVKDDITYARGQRGGSQTPTKYMMHDLISGMRNMTLKNFTQL